MDDCSAAMVLMSLSCSPKSPIFFPGHHRTSLPERGSYSCQFQCQSGLNDNSCATLCLPSCVFAGKYSHSWTPGSSADSGVTFDSPVQLSLATRRHLTPGSKSSEARRRVCASGDLTTCSQSRSTTPSPSNSAADEEEERREEEPESAGEAAAAAGIMTLARSRSGDDEGVSMNDDDDPHHEPAVDVSTTATPKPVHNYAIISKSKQQQQQLLGRKSSSVLFTCTWPGCESRYSSNAAIEQHVRSMHSVEAGEEDFYYTEVERGVAGAAVVMDAMSSSSSSSQSPVPSPGPTTAARFMLHASSSHPPNNMPMPTWSHLDMARPAHEDPEYQRQLKQQQQLSSPITIPGISFAHHASAFAPKNKFIRMDGTVRVSPGGSSLLQVSPKSRVGRTRGESRKCRKVYGMESRDLWCTQCKWKKACTRFHD